MGFVSFSNLPKNRDTITGADAEHLVMALTGEVARTGAAPISPAITAAQKIRRSIDSGEDAVLDRDEFQAVLEHIGALEAEMGGLTPHLSALRETLRKMIHG